MGWINLFIAGLFEIGFAYFIKESNGFKNIIPSILFFICSIFSLYFLNKAISILPISTAYSVWTGIGAVGSLIIGIIVYNEPTSLVRIILIVNIIISIIILTTFK